MKRRSQSFNTIALLLLAPFLTPAAVLPEPGRLVMYGTVPNTADGNAQITTGTLTWTITPASGSPITVTTPLTDISGEYSYALGVPFASVVGNATPACGEPGEACGVRWLPVLRNSTAEDGAGKGADTAVHSPTESLRLCVFALKSRANFPEDTNN